MATEKYTNIGNDMKQDNLTKLTKRIGDYLAAKLKDDDNDLFGELTDQIVEDFVADIKHSNPVLGSWVEEWKKMNYVPKKKPEEKKQSLITTIIGGGSRSGSCCDDDPDDYGGCGITTRNSTYGGC